MALVDAFLVMILLVLVDDNTGDYDSGFAILVLIVQESYITGVDGYDQCIAGDRLYLKCLDQNHHNQQ